MAQGLSVIICCYNSATRIADTLKHLMLQKVTKDILWEIILVNNNSTDNTAETARLQWQNYTTAKPPFKIVYQATPGLSAARSMGVSEASHDIIVFCDDDNWLADNYIQDVFNIFKNNSGIGITGGSSVALCQVTPPYWFNKYSIHFAVGGKKQSAYTNTVTGAGMGIRKQVYAQLAAAQFQTQLSDRKGKILLSGGDDELCIAARLLGYQVYYSSNLQFTHFMPANRLNWQYFSKLYTTGFAWSGIVMELYYLVYNNQHILNTWKCDDAYKYVEQKITNNLLRKIKTPLQLGRFIKALFVINEGNDYALKCKLAFNRYVLVKKNKNELLHIYASIASFAAIAARTNHNSKPTA